MPHSLFMKTIHPHALRSTQKAKAKRRSMSVLNGSATALLAIFLASQPTKAATFTWTGATNNNWNNANNWNPAATPNPVADDIIDVSTLDLTAGKTFNLNNGTSSANRTFGTLRIGDAGGTVFGWTINGNGPVGADPRLILAVGTGTGTIQVNNGTTTLNAHLAGTQGLTKLGTGTLLLANPANTISGGIFLNAGTLSFVDGALNNNVVTSGGTVTLTLSGHTTDVSNLIRIGDGSTLTAGVSTVATDTTVFATPFQTGPLGTGAFTKGNASTLIITGANTYTGGTRVNLGRLILSGGDNRLSSAGALSFGTGANSGVVQLGDDTSASHQTVSGLSTFGTGLANAIVGGHSTNSILTVNNTGTHTFNGTLGGVGTNENHLALVKSGAGSLTLGGNNSFVGNVTINGGRLILTSGAALGAGPKTLTISAATDTPSLQLDGAAGGFALSASTSLTTSNDDATAPAIVNVAGANVIAGSITPTTGGAGTGNTRVLVTAGSLTLNGNIAPSVSATADLDLILDGAGNGAVNGTVSDTGARKLGVNKQGAGTWTLSAANSYSRPTVIGGGRLNLSTAQTGGGAISLADGTTLGITVAGAGQSLQTSALTLGSAAGTTLAFDLGNNGNPTVPVITATSFSAAVGGLHTFQIAATNLSVGQFPLVGYTGSIGGAGYAGLSLGTLPARVTANLVDDSANSRVNLNVTAFDLPRWIGGVDGNWDADPDGTGALGTLNWREVNSGNATRYLQGTGGTDSVLFDDTAGVPTNVILTTTLTPGTVRVAASTNAFVFSGSGRLSGATNLVKEGSSVLTLLNSGDNDYTGTTTITGGTIQVGDGATPAVGTIGTGPIVNNAVLVFNRPDDLTAANTISGTGTITKQGAGVLTLSGNNSTYDGVIHVATGTLKLGNANALGSAAGATNVAAGAALDVTGFAVTDSIGLNGGTIRSVSGGGNRIDGTIAITGGGIVDSVAGSIAINGAITGTGGFVKNGVGNLVLNGSNSFSGGLTSNGGTVTLSAENTFSDGLAINAGTVIAPVDQSFTGGTVVAGGATLQIGATTAAGSVGTGDIALNSASGVATLSIVRTDDVTIANNITSSGAGTNQVSIGAGGAGSLSRTVTLSGANTFNGNVTILGGALRVTNSASLGTGTKTVTIANASRPALLLDGSAGNVNLPAEIGYRISSDGGATNVAANLAAIVNKAGDNVINGRISQINGGGGNGAIYVEAGTLTVNGQIDAEGATGNRTLVLNGPANGTVNGVISDTNSAATSVVTVQKAGTGTWTLTGANAFTGAVTVQDGRLKIGTIDETTSNPQPLGIGTGAVTLGTATTAGTLEYTGTTATTLNRLITVGGVGGGTVINSSGELLTLGGTLTFSGRPLTLTGGDFDVIGSVTGANANSRLIVADATVQLGNAGNTYNGQTIVHSGGVLKLVTDSGIPIGSGLVLGESIGNTEGTFDLNGFNQTLNSISHLGSGAAIITNGAVSGSNTLEVAGAATFDGVIQDGEDATVALTKSGSGTLALTGDNTYTGTTAITAGTLLVQGSLSGTSSVNVSGGGMLGGTGTIAPGANGDVVLSTGGILAPGASAGTLTLELGTGQLDLSPVAGGTGYLQFELGATTSDRLVITTGVLNLGIGGLDFEDFAFTDTGDFGPGTYTLFDTNNPILGSLGENVNGSLSGLDAALSFAGGTGGNEDLVLTVIPEPTSALLLLTGLGLLGIRRRSRSSAARA